MSGKSIATPPFNHVFADRLNILSRISALQRLERASITQFLSSNFLLAENLPFASSSDSARPDEQFLDRASDLDSFSGFQLPASDHRRSLCHNRRDECKHLLRSGRPSSSGRRQQPAPLLYSSLRPGFYTSSIGMYTWHTKTPEYRSKDCEG